MPILRLRNLASIVLAGLPIIILLILSAAMGPHYLSPFMHSTVGLFLLIVLGASFLAALAVSPVGFHILPVPALVRISLWIPVQLVGLAIALLGPALLRVLNQ